MIIFKLLFKTSSKISYNFLTSLGYKGIVNYDIENDKWELESVTHFFPGTFPEFDLQDQFRLKRALVFCFSKKIWPEEATWAYC